MIKIPEHYDYVGVYLTDQCHLACPYCITKHHHADYGKQKLKYLDAKDWIRGLNRLVLPKDVPITLQGGDPFLHKGIWEILENVNHKMDILTALPPFLKKEHFLKLKTLDWNKRQAPYPTIRVSYHQGQNDYQKLIPRISELNDILSIGLFYLEHPSNTEEEVKKIKELADKYGVELRKKEFLGVFEGKQYGSFKFKDACCGTKKGIEVQCRNTVVPISPEGTLFRCHSDLYFNRKELAIGNLLDENFVFTSGYSRCENFGLCSECDVKIKNNHYQQFGYTSVDIQFSEKEKGLCSKNA